MCGKQCVPELETSAAFSYRAPDAELPVQEGYGQSRCFLSKARVDAESQGSCNCRGIQGACFWELFCGITTPKQSKTKAFVIFLLPNWNKLPRNTEVFFTQFWAYLARQNDTSAYCDAELCRDGKACPNHHALELEGAYFYQRHWPLYQSKG